MSHEQGIFSELFKRHSIVGVWIAEDGVQSAISFAYRNHRGWVSAGGAVVSAKRKCHEFTTGVSVDWVRYDTV
jgi:hypothetical protein